MLHFIGRVNKTCSHECRKRMHYSEPREFRGKCSPKWKSTCWVEMEYNIKEMSRRTNIYWTMCIIGYCSQFSLNRIQGTTTFVPFKSPPKWMWSSQKLDRNKTWVFSNITDKGDYFFHIILLPLYSTTTTAHQTKNIMIKWAWVNKVIGA